MAIIDPTAEQDIGRLWSAISELSEQLSRNRAESVLLYGHADQVAKQVLHGQTGFVLRRFNTHLSQDEYDAELIRMTSDMTAENKELQYDNKQLQALIREYEQTLETLMTSFRNHARVVQEKELDLIRTYETQLLEREDKVLEQELTQSCNISQSLTRLSWLLRMTMRALGGEEPPSGPSAHAQHNSFDADPYPVGRAEAENLRGESSTEIEDPMLAPWVDAASAQQALEREVELARLEHENVALRRLLSSSSIAPPGAASVAPEPEQSVLVPPPLRRGVTGLPIHHLADTPLGGPSGHVGPYGTVKALENQASGT